MSDLDTNLDISLDTLTKEFKRLLDGIRTKYSLEEWRYAYSKVIYSGAIEILHKFPEIIIGPAPLAPLPLRSEKRADPILGNPGPMGAPLHPVIDGQAPPFHPSAIGKLVCIVLGNCPEPPQQT
jgi:hypothetical protein